MANDDRRVLLTLKRYRRRLQELHEEPLDQAVEYYPDTWIPRLQDWPSANRLVDRRQAVRRGRDVGFITRRELVERAKTPILQPGEGLVDLLVACQVWGSGRSNGRGPRYLTAALDAPQLHDVLREITRLVTEHEVGQAYRLSLPGWGPAFSTKFMYALAAAQDLPGHPRALILDARVWKSLSSDGISWSSREAAGSRYWNRRYEAYVAAMQRWSDDMDVRSDALERLFFERAGSF